MGKVMMQKQEESKDFVSSKKDSLLVNKMSSISNQALIENLGVDFKVGRPNDSFEREADRVSESLLEGNSVGNISTVSGNVAQRMVSNDTQDSIMQKFGSGMNADFSNVKIHTDTQADQMCKDMGARAFTNKKDIYFGKGEYKPNTKEGQKVIAHELVHTIQQGAVNTNTGISTVGQSSDYAQMLPDAETVRGMMGDSKNSLYHKLEKSIEHINEEVKNTISSNKEQNKTLYSSISKIYIQAIDIMKKYIKSNDGHRAWFREGKKKHEARKAMTEKLLEQAEIELVALAHVLFDSPQEGKTVMEALAGETRMMTLEDGQFEDTIMGGSMNQVYKYSTGDKKSGFFKPGIKKGQKMNATLTSYLSDAGIEIKDEENIADNFNKREVAMARLDSILGANVIGGARMAKISNNSSLEGKEYIDTRKNNMKRTFNVGAGETGVLMDAAKGGTIKAYNWDMPIFDRSKVEKGNWGIVCSGLTYSQRAGRKEKEEAIIREGRKHITNRKLKAEKETDTTLKASDPNFQRDMSRLHIMDALSGNIDRHVGNFLVDIDENGNYKNLTGIDNDISFGNRHEIIKEAKGKYTGLPGEMYMDEEICNRIDALEESQIRYLLMDLLTEDEISALWSRIVEMKGYIDRMRKKNYLIKDWNEETAKQQLLQIQGEIKTYYQRHLLSEGNYIY